MVTVDVRALLGGRVQALVDGVLDQILEGFGLDGVSVRLTGPLGVLGPLWSVLQPVLTSQSFMNLARIIGMISPTTCVMPRTVLPCNNEASYMAVPNLRPRKSP